MTVSTYPGPIALNTSRASIPMATILCVVLAVAAFWWQLRLGVNPDTTWLTLMAERWLAGERLFVDIHENNPPASVYLYVPAVLAGKILGIRSELALQILTIAVFAGALYAAYRMLVRAGFANRFRLEWVAVAAVAIFLLLPASSFAQREHFAAILSLPVVGLAAVRSAGRVPALWMIVLAGVSLGCVAAIKPPLIAIALALALLSVWHSKSWRPLIALENWIAAAVFAAYLAAVVFLHPAFVRDVMPLLRDVYLPNRFIQVLVILPAFYVIVALVFHSFMMHRPDWFTPPLSLVYAVAGGYFFSFVVQMKFFDYHALPVSMFLLLALSMSVLQLRRQADVAPGIFAMSKGSRIFTITIVLGLGAFNAWDFYSPQYNGNLSRLIRTLKPAAKVTGFGMVPGSQIRAVRDAGGSWVGSFGYTYVPGYAQWYRKNAQVGPHWAERLAHWERWTAEISTGDIVQKKPDIIVLRDEELVRWPDWIKKYPKLDAAMSAYRFHSRVDVGKGIYPVLVYVRK